MNIKKLIIGGIAVAGLVGGVVGPALAAAPRPHRPDVTSATPDTYNANWVIGVSQDGGAKGQSIKLGDHSTDATDFAYYSFRNWWDQKLSDVTKVRASFLEAEGTVNTPGSPRISVEVDKDGDGTFDCPELGPCVNDAIIYLAPSSCSDPAASGGGWVESDFTGDKTNCTINDSSGNVYTSDASGTAWSKLVADYGADAKVWFAFLIQDATVGTNYVDRIYLDSVFFTKEP